MKCRPAGCRPLEGASLLHGTFLETRQSAQKGGDREEQGGPVFDQIVVDQLRLGGMADQDGGGPTAKGK